MPQMVQVLLGPLCFVLREDTENRWGGVLCTFVIVLLLGVTCLGNWRKPLKVLSIVTLAAVWMFFGWIHSVADW